MMFLKSVRVATIAIVATLCVSHVATAQAKKPTAKAPAAPAAAEKPADGAKIFTTTCVACHQANGEGLEEKYPPLTGSEWVTGDEAKLVRIVMFGLTGPVEVAGETFTAEMPGWGGVLKDADIAAVLTYIRSTWANKAPPVSLATVSAVRKANAARKKPWTIAELAAIKK